MLKSASDKSLKALALQVYLDGGVDSCLFGLSEWVRAWNTEPDYEDVRPFQLHLFKQSAAFPDPQIDQQNRGIVLLENGVKAFGLVNKSDLNQVTQESANPPN